MDGLHLTLSNMDAFASFFQVETHVGLKDVEINRIWVEGDNQDNSSDSRHYGAVNQKLIAGVAEYIVWPPWRIGKVKKIVDDERSYWG